MAKRKKKTSWFGFGSGKKRTKVQKKQRTQAARTTLLIFAVIVIVVAVVVGFIFLDRYGKSATGSHEKIGRLKLVNVPGWVGQDLRAKIISAVGSSSDDFKLTSSTAAKVGQRLSEMAWLYDVKVRLSDTSVVVNAGYRKPIATIRSAERLYYIDKKMVVLDYVPMEKIATPEIIGIPGNVITWRSIGNLWARDDLAAAIELLDLLGRMDDEVAPDAPLLFEIKSVDVSNYDGRRKSKKPHIVFYAIDGTEIRWGARKGAWHKYLEATDEEKLTILYNTYEQMGSLQLKSANRVSYIDLTQPQSLALPIDRY